MTVPFVPFVDFRTVWLACNAELFAEGQCAVEDIGLQVQRGGFIAIVAASTIAG